METKPAYKIILILAQTKTHMPDYFHFSNNKKTDKKVSEPITEGIHNECDDLFSEIKCFESTFSLQLKEAATHIRYHQKE